MRYILLILFLFGCSSEKRSIPTADTGIKIYSWDVQSACIKGVTYYLFDRGIAPAYEPSGKLIKCKWQE